MKTFFILSLPRCRTAWLANFLTYENSYCFHEGLLGLSSVEEIGTLFSSTNKPIVGNSDCGNIFFIDKIRRIFPDAAFVIVDRDKQDVADELSGMGEEFSNVEMVDHAYQLLESVKKDIPYLSVDFNCIDERACRDIWQHCIGTKFDARRWEMLDGIDMQIIPEKKISQMTRDKEKLQHLFGENL